MRGVAPGSKIGREATALILRHAAASRILDARQPLLRRSQKLVCHLRMLVAEIHALARIIRQAGKENRVVPREGLVPVGRAVVSLSILDQLPLVAPDRQLPTDRPEDCIVPAVAAS